ncbi:tyrosine-type recombinase/integrase [Viridibacillus sp. NPDC096237]|uniref:tyrosine-type recombinase/integrase n=1 Tax=Viridibacillus sp. NPDC096237 TaxID=3390721 RepID=UPI003CFC9A8A
MNSILNVNDLSLQTLKKEVANRSMTAELQNRLDIAEKNHSTLYSDFNDLNMIVWYINKREHLNPEHDRNERTKQEYERELAMFVHQLLIYSLEMDLDIEKVQDNSLFKSLQPRHIRKYQDWLATSSPHVKQKGPYSPATLARKTTIIKSFLAFLYESKYNQEILHTGFYNVKVRADDRPNRDFSPLEVIKLLDTYKDMNHVVMFSIIHVLSTTGLRNEEFCRLNVGDLKLDYKTVSYYFDVLGKGNKRRQIPLKEKVVSSIQEFRKVRCLPPLDAGKLNEPLFTTGRCTRFSVSYFTQYIAKEINSLALPIFETRNTNITPHFFRHAFAIISKMNGADIYDIMRSLGHSKMIYLDKIFEKERHAIHSWKPELMKNYI